MLFRSGRDFVHALLCALRMYITYVCFIRTSSNRLTLGVSHTISIPGRRTHNNGQFTYTPPEEDLQLALPLASQNPPETCTRLESGGERKKKRRSPVGFVC